MDLAPSSSSNAATLPASSVRTITTARIRRTCGISSRSPFLRHTYFPPWLDVACPTRRFPSSLARSRSYLAMRKAWNVTYSAEGIDARAVPRGRLEEDTYMSYGISVT